MLWKLLVEYLRPHRGLLLAVVVFQLAQSIASLYLPTLNADIIDEGVAKGDTGYILRVGTLMLVITLVQIACAVTAVYFGAKAAMGVGRDLRAAIFTRVGAFSEQEVTRFGAPSLITRSTNDVQQVQQLVLMAATLMVAAPMLSIGGVIMAIRQDVQLAQSIASLYLPTLNADIIDEGVAKGDTGYILRHRRLMLVITLLQIACAVVAVYFGAKAAMGVGRDLRGAIFTRVGEFSEQEVTRFGAPSLITRSTNDVQQVQQLVLMSATLMVAAPMLSIGGVIMAVRQDVQLSWLIAVSVPVLLIAVGLIITRMVPLFRQDAEADRHREPGAPRAAHRHPGGAGLRPRGHRDRPVRPGQRGRHGHGAAGRPADGARVPRGDAGAERLQRGRDLVRLVPDPGRLHAGGHADRVPELPDADPDVRHDGHLHGDDDPARRGLRGPDRRGAGHRVQRPAAADTRWPSRPAGRGRGELEMRDVGFAYPGAEQPGPLRDQLHRPGRADDGDHRQPPAPARPPW